MRNNDHEGTEAFHYTANDKAMNAHASAPDLPERLMREPMTSDLSVIAAQLIGACRVLDGDHQAASEYISHAMAFFYGKRRFEPSVTRGLSKVCDAAADGCIDDGNDLRIKCLRTGVVH